MSTEMIYAIVSTSSEDTKKLGELLGQIIKAPAVVELRSDLGGGKTTFASGFGQGFGVKDILTSPSFNISKIYKAKDNAELHHFDFYRLSDPGILANQLNESLENSKVVTLVEWANLVKNILPKDHLVIVFKPVENNSDERTIEIHYPESEFASLKKLETNWQATRP